MLKRYFRAEVRGLDTLLEVGGALLGANHSGGSLTPDVIVFGSAFYEAFGYDRPLFPLAYSGVFIGPFEGWLRRPGVIHASRENAAAAPHSRAAVLVFPGGDYGAYRPTRSGNVIDFGGPIVSIGGQETQLSLTRGAGWAKKLGLGQFRVGILPIGIGFPSASALSFPQQSISGQDRHKGVGTDLQDLDALARDRRVPLIGRASVSVVRVAACYAGLFSQTPAGAEVSPTSCRVRIPGGAAATSNAALTAGIAVIVSHS